jgi:uracil-DNA glycosylase
VSPSSPGSPAPLPTAAQPAAEGPSAVWPGGSLLAVELPSRDCTLCPRLAEFREVQRAGHPDWFNAPVPSFGAEPAELLIVGLAPGLRGANRTGRPFTGDYAGELLYATLRKFGLAAGCYDARADDGLALVGARITNAVRCVPPQNKPEPREIAACRRFLAQEIAASPGVRAFVALGAIAHDAVLSTLGLRRALYRFGHGAVHTLPDGRLLADSYHCSRLNTNTRRLTPAMFEAVFAEVLDRIEPDRGGRAMRQTHGTVAEPR